MPERPVRRAFALAVAALVYGVEWLAEEVAELIEALGHESAAHDWSGAAAWELALRHAPLGRGSERRDGQCITQSRRRRWSR